MIELLSAVMYIEYVAVHWRVMLTLTTSVYACPPPHTEPTLTINNITHVLESVRDMDMDRVAVYLGIPHSKRSEIEMTHPNLADRRPELSRYYITHHPTPSWLHITTAMWGARQNTALLKVNSLYLRGKTCTHVWCITSSLGAMATN